jgi:hypothetical protein
MLTSGAGTVTASSSVLTTIPAGPCTVLLSNNGTASPVWAGIGGSVSAESGLPVPSGITPVTLPVYAGGGGSKLSVVTTSGTATIGFVISTPTGGTGP